MGAIYPKPRTTRRQAGHRIYPYLLRKLKIPPPDPLWSTDIAHIRLQAGSEQSTAVMDGYSRRVLAREHSNQWEGAFCCEALDQALAISQPEVFDTDPGSRFASHAVPG